MQKHKLRAAMRRRFGTARSSSAYEYRKVGPHWRIENAAGYWLEGNFDGDKLTVFRQKKI